MSSSNRELINAIFNELKNNETLSAYVKNISIANVGVSQKIFPFVTIANAPYNINPASACADFFTYNVEILAGTFCMVPNTAYQGSDVNGREGILQLARDVESAVRNKTFGNRLMKPVSETAVRIFQRKDRSGMLWNAVVSFPCVRWQNRP